MEDDEAGLRFARHIREETHAGLARIILRTGQPGTAPEEKVIVEYDINDYKAKTELTNVKLFTTVISALRSYRDLISLEETKQQVEAYAKAAEHFVPEEFLRRMEVESITEVEVGQCVCAEMTVMFSDIRSFTTLSEAMTAQETFKFLNSYIERMEAAITEHHGFVDRYIGDAIMALFDTPDDAIRAGVQMLENLKAYNEGRARDGHEPIEIGIGLNTGQLILGTVGGARKMQQTVISDAVNLSARIEELTKTYRTPLLINESTLFGIENHSDYRIRYVDRVPVRGFSEPAVVHEIYDADAPELRQAKDATEAPYCKAWTGFQSGDYQGAATLFKECCQKNPQDTVCKLYLERCEKILEVAGINF